MSRSTTVSTKDWKIFLPLPPSLGTLSNLPPFSCPENDPLGEWTKCNLLILNLAFLCITLRGSGNGSHPRSLFINSLWNTGQAMKQFISPVNVFEKPQNIDSLGLSEDFEHLEVYLPNWKFVLYMIHRYCEYLAHRSLALWKEWNIILNSDI